MTSELFKIYNIEEQEEKYGLLIDRYGNISQYVLGEGLWDKHTPDYEIYINTGIKNKSGQNIYIRLSELHKYIDKMVLLNDGVEVEE